MPFSSSTVCRFPGFRFSTASEQQRERALVAARWPQGWQCSHCACKRRFCYRFSRRFDLAAMLPTLLRALVTAAPLPLKVLRVSEVGR